MLFDIRQNYIKKVGTYLFSAIILKESTTSQIQKFTLKLLSTTQHICITWADKNVFSI